jgi:hypothetical protein
MKSIRRGTELRSPPMATTGWFLSVLSISTLLISSALMSQTRTAASDARSNQIEIEYFPPKDSALNPIYALVKERRALEKMQEIFSPFRLPIKLTLRMGDCGGVANAWYNRPEISVCYEYLHEILQSMPKETTPEGITPAEAVIGQFFYVMAHEMGHAVFDILARSSVVRRTQPITFLPISCYNSARINRGG